MSGEQLKTFREQRGWSQDELAGILNDSLERRYSSSTISQWETGKRSVPQGVAAFLETLQLEQALPAGAGEASPGPADSSSPSASTDEPPGGPGAPPRPAFVLAGGTYARVCTELWEMIATTVSVFGAAVGNPTLIMDGQLIDHDKIALGRAYGRLAETNETFRKLLTGAAGSGAWLEIAIVTSGTASAIMRNHLTNPRGGEGVPAVPSQPNGPTEHAAVGV